LSAIDSRHCYNITLGRCVLDRDLNECAARQVLFDQMQRHDAKPEPGMQEGKLGAEMGKSPHSRRQYVDGASRHIHRVGVNRLDVFGEHGCWNRRAESCQRMLRRDDQGRPDVQQPFLGELRRNDRPRVGVASGSDSRTETSLTIL
jgi:hypothetical protein